jgi:lysophospholipase
MGGTLNALTLARGGHGFDAALLTAPMMGVAAVRALPVIGHLIARTFSGLGLGGGYVVRHGGFDPMRGPFATNDLTHDEGRYERFRDQLRACPDLALGGVTWGWLLFALDACAALARRGAAEAIGIPLSIVTAGDERLVMNPPARRFALRAPRGRYLEIPGAWHEVLMETDDVRAQVWRAFEVLTAEVVAG